MRPSPPLDFDPTAVNASMQRGSVDKSTEHQLHAPLWAADVGQNPQANAQPLAVDVAMDSPGTIPQIFVQDPVQSADSIGLPQPQP